MDYKCLECGSKNIKTWKSGETTAYKCLNCNHHGNQTEKT